MITYRYTSQLIHIPQSTLELDLRLQEYIELARARKTTEAIIYSKKHLSSWQDTHSTQLIQASALLAYPPATTCAPYKVLSCIIRHVVLLEF
jgi:macrophage erythroblast attacher